MRLSTSLLYASLAASGLAYMPIGQSERSLDQPRYQSVEPVGVGQQPNLLTKRQQRVRPAAERGTTYICFEWETCFRRCGADFQRCPYKPGTTKPDGNEVKIRDHPDQQTPPIPPPKGSVLNVMNQDVPVKYGYGYEDREGFGKARGATLQRRQIGRYDQRKDYSQSGNVVPADNDVVGSDAKITIPLGPKMVEVTVTRDPSA
ncbi:MAG: hypothetical protein M1823_004871 [Watsoniomyces obsoletus]|nr:MAG: hypothetical protein M1823_004871 [Watsoniomyces obsoletus]